MATVWIPSLLQEFTNGAERVEVAGKNVRQLIAALDAVFPGIGSRLCDGDGIKRGLAVVVDTQVSTLGLMQPVQEHSEVHFLPAIGGG